MEFLNFLGAMIVFLYMASWAIGLLALVWAFAFCFWRAGELRDTSSGIMKKK